MGIIEEIVESINAADYEAGISLLKQWGTKHGYEHLAEEVLVPLMASFTKVYGKSDEIPLARAYIAAKVVEESMRLVSLSMGKDRETPGTRGPVVVGNIEDDFHALGRKIVTTFLRSDGWNVHDLGNDVLAELFVEKALETDAHIIGVSAMMYSTAKNIRSIRTLLDERELSGRIKLAVGGAVFVLRPDLVKEVGGDGTCRSAVGVSALFAELEQQSVKR